MRTTIEFVGGSSTEFGDEATIKMTAHGVEVQERQDGDLVRVLFPWPRIEKVTQRGEEVTAVYTY